MLDGFTLDFPSVSPFSFQRPRPKESELSLLCDDFVEKVENEGPLAVDCLPVSKISWHCGSYMRWYRGLYLHMYPFLRGLGYKGSSSSGFTIPIEALEREYTARSSNQDHSRLLLWTESATGQSVAMANNQSAPLGRCMIVFDNIW